ncbi:MAG: glycoside hydrolase family 3 N-terminal domain-containing protein [Chthoniobacterales bacterium]
MSSTHRGQLLLIGIPGKTIDPETADLIRRIQPGGFILFGRNIETAPQLRQLTDDLRSLSKIEPIITIDQEGGRVSRLKLIGQEPPNAQQLREKGERELIRRHGELTADLLRLFGFNLDLCPVLDISFDDEADNSLRGRCYGTDVAQVIDFAGTFNSALQNGGILSCGKHFPGYSAATNDPHHDLPVLDRPRELMEAHELAVFRHFADKIDSMMIGHINYSGLDKSSLPASLSPAIITDLLRRDMKFKGLVMTDDLDMGAILNHYPLDETLRLALAAGNDQLMICHRTHLAEKALEFLNTLPDSATETALANTSDFKKKISPPHDFDLENFAALDRGVWDLRVATLGEERAAQRSPEDGKRSPVEVY